MRPLRTTAPYLLERLAGGVLRTAHRGAPRLAPDNTLEAVRAATAFPVDFVEVDVHLTADGHLLLWHDDALITPGGLFPIREHSLAELRALGLPDGTLATLPEAVETVRGHCGLMIDLKAPDLHSAVERDVRAAGFDDVLVCGGFADSLAYLEAALPNVAVSLTPDGAEYRDLAGVLTRQPHLDALTVYWRVVGPRLMNAAREVGALVLAWTVDHPHIADHVLAQGVHGLTSNNHELLTSLRAERAGSGVG
ncbi:glycerophosphoryl diester phosphodiesterase (plasmid) [Deinococcus aetherius]|uniref:Glycerophosphoryl diester phosphodiesterase n=1 Tax=Deinococcus aetherius TaxID=200252 RepID=A0ABN6RR55_9DEIO|nr:glycerophosphodiester phosphodiesterase [Deinococcus aetherius]BDP44474.1 glycerophosphoryl diester phosphodiesterase [Deinococcus aetherius]